MIQHANYSFLLDKAINLLKSSKRDSCKVLDYGCGKGLLVEEGILKSIDFYGVELFGHGSGINIKDDLARKGLLGTKVLELVDEKIPFPDAFFDLVVSNQVFEHIPEIGPVISEISRVLKPGGQFLCITPYQGTFREGHCEIPFAHWFMEGSKLQYYWLYAFKIFGFGRRKHVRDPGEWAQFFSNWLKENIYYDSFGKIDSLFKSHFLTVKYIEEEYLEFRLFRIKKLFLSRIVKTPFIRILSKWFVRKYGSLIILSNKSN